MFAFGTTGYWIFTVISLVLTLKAFGDYNKVAAEAKDFINMNKWTGWMFSPAGIFFVLALNICASFIPYYNAYVAIATPVCYLIKFVAIKNLDKKFNSPMAH